MLDGVCTGEGLIVADDVNWTDYHYSAKGRIISDSVNNELALVVRYVDSNNFIWAGLGCWGHRVSISRKINGVTQELAFAGSRTEVVPGKDYVVEVRAVGNLLELYIDGVFELSVQDGSLPNGGIGIRPYSSHVELDYVDATVPPVLYTLVIESSEGGTTDPVPNTYRAVEGSSVQVAAIPQTDYMFDHWELDGVNVGATSPYSVTMDKDHVVLAVFVVKPPPPPGKQHLTISSTTGGTTTPAAGVWEYDEGSTAPVTATPNTGYNFKQWLLDNNAITPVQPTIAVDMDADHTLVAVFESAPTPKLWTWPFLTWLQNLIRQRLG